MTRVGSLFSGTGALDMATVAVFGGEVVWHCEVDPAASRVLAHHWPGVPNLGDITAVDWDRVSPVDILTGGFPCQDVSQAGKRDGMRPDNRSGLWAHMAYAAERLRPKVIVIENVRGLLQSYANCDMEPCPWCMGDSGIRGLRALGAVLGDLADIGYDARWCGVHASDVGGPHKRFRVFVVAVVRDTNLTVGHQRRESASGHPQGAGAWPDAGGSGRALATDANGNAARRLPHSRGVERETAPDVRRTRLGSGSAAARAAGPATSDAQGVGRPEGLTESTGTRRGSHAALGGAEPPDRSRHVEWGQYEPAIRRWERVLGRAAPDPTCLGRRNARVLSPSFVEWMQGLPAGHVTDVDGLRRVDQLRLLGNGVVPQQAEYALRLLSDMEVVAA